MGGSDQTGHESLSNLVKRLRNEKNRKKQKKKIPAPVVSDLFDSEDSVDSGPIRIIKRKKKAIPNSKKEVSGKKRPLEKKSAGKTKKSKKQKIRVEITDSESSEVESVTDAHITSEEDNVSEDLPKNPIKGLREAAKDREESEGCWGQTFAGLGGSENELLHDTEELFSEIYVSIIAMLKKGGSPIQKLNRQVTRLEARWGILQKSISKKRIRNVDEREDLEFLATESIGFLSKFSKEYSPINSTPSAVNGLIALYKQKTTNQLLGKTNCIHVVIKLKGALKTYRALNGASWASMSGWKAPNRGYNGKSSFRFGAVV